MILATHAVAGGALGFWLHQDPALAAGAAIASHFLLDVPPHWHYPLRAFPRGGPRAPLRSARFARDLAATALDTLAGLALVLFAIPGGPERYPAVFLGALCGVLPDLFQLLYHLRPKFPFAEIHAFHKWIHAEKRLDDRPLVGIGSQALFVLILLALLAGT